MPFLYRPRKLRTKKKIGSEHARKILSQFDRCILEKEYVANSSYDQLVEPLYAIDKAERGVDWTERFVVCYILKRIKMRRAQTLRRKIIEFWRVHGDLEKVQSFENRISSAMSVSSRINESNFFLNLSSVEPADTIRGVQEVVNILNENGYLSFINSGTLLGAARQGSFLAHDNDIDIAVIIDANSEARVSWELIKFYHVLRTLLPRPIKTSFKSPVLKTCLENGVRIDIFPAWFSNEKLYVWPHAYGELGKYDVLPLGTLALENLEFPVPRNFSDVLAINYGASWKTPDPNFVFPWSLARRKFRWLLFFYWICVRINFTLLPFFKIIQKRQ